MEILFIDYNGIMFRLFRFRRENIIIFCKCLVISRRLLNFFICIYVIDFYDIGYVDDNCLIVIYINLLLK